MSALRNLAWLTAFCTVLSSNLWASENFESIAAERLGALAPLLEKVRTAELGSHLSETAARERMEEGKVVLGTWLRIGPFRDQSPILTWMDNVASSFAHPFEAEIDLWRNGGAPFLDRTYAALNFPATPHAVRSWTEHPDWVDGYLCDLPRGPAPSAGESHYVYREIECRDPVDIEIDFVVRSPASDRALNDHEPNQEWFRRQARFKCYFNGLEIMKYVGKGNPPGRVTLRLRAGTNRFLAKITNNRHACGFSFAIHGLHPAPRRPGVHEMPWQPFQAYRPSDQPYVREVVAPDWYRRGETWLDALYASAKSLADSGLEASEGIRTKVWDCLQRDFTDARSRYEIELTRSADDVFWKGILASSSREEIDKEIAQHHLEGLCDSLEMKPEEILKALATDANEPDYADQVREAYFAVCHYREGLVRLRDFRFHAAPMPGIEAAARDSRGRVVTPMERDLENYPTSAEGDRHVARLEALRAEAMPLLERIVRTGHAEFAQVLRFNRQIEEMWATEIAELPPLLFLERPAYHYDALMFTHAGGAPAYIRVFDPAKRTVRDIFHSPEMRAHDINLSWDALSVLVGGGGEVARVGVDGSDYRVITQGQSPAEMPDGRIVFFDNAPGISPCKADRPRQLLFIVDGDGKSRKVVSANLTIDTTPQILNDGRVVFCRWDYGVNKNVFNRHAIWTQNPDGTGLDLFFGNTIIDPFGFYRPRQIPGRPELVTIFGTHHNHNAGLVGLMWQGHGREGGDGVGFRRVTPDTASVGDACPHWAYQDPYPLNEQLFLVSYAGANKHKTGLYLLDRYGNKKCIFEPARPLAAHCPQPLVARKRPTLIPDRARIAEWKPTDPVEQLLGDPDWSQKATMLLQDVYKGIEPEVARGRIAHIAVMEQVMHTDPRGGAMGVGAMFYAQRLVGLVPVEEDGSAYFEVPAMRSLYFHALDADGKMLMTMGSDFHAMPGETRGCIGCHEMRKNIHTSSTSAAQVPIAATSPPARPKMQDWSTNGIIEYEAVVQPVLDKYCVRCHSGDKAKAGLDLTGSRTTVFNMSYLQLTDKGLVHYVPGTGHTHAVPTLDYDEQAPLSKGTLLSKLTKYLEDSSHSESEISWEDRYRVYAWIDANVPFYSHYKQMSPTVLNDDARSALAGIYSRRCAHCHDERPRKDAVSWMSKYHIWTHAGPQPGQWNIADSGMRVRHLNLSRPADSMALLAPLAREAGGLGLCGRETGEAVFADKTDCDYVLALDAITSGVVTRRQIGVRCMLSDR